MTALGSADIPVRGNELTRPATDARGADVHVRGHRLARPDCDAGPPEVATGKARRRLFWAEVDRVLSVPLPKLNSTRLRTLWVRATMRAAGVGYW
jgi:hypothetical protein